jgi:hypothetical protein
VDADSRLTESWKAHTAHVLIQTVLI